MVKDRGAMRVNVMFMAALPGFLALLMFEMHWMTEMSVQFFKLINYQVFHRHLFREVIYLLQAPSYLLMKLTMDIGMLKAAFTLPYLLVPLASLWISWTLVKRERPHLFIWPALSILLGHVHCQHQMTSEHMMTVQLTWPFLFGLLTLQGPAKVLWTLLWSGLFFITHPVSAFSYALAAIILSLQKVETRAASRKKALLVALMMSLSLAKVLLIAQDSYDKGQLWVYSLHSPQNVFISFFNYSRKNLHLPLLNLACFWFLGGLIFSKKGPPSIDVKGLPLLALVLALILTYVLPFAITGLEAFMHWTIYFRLSMFLSLPFFLWAILEARPTHAPQGIAQDERLRLLPWIGICYSLSLAVFSWNWHRIDQQATLEMKAHEGRSRCVDVGTLTRLPKAFVNYIATPTYFMLKQERRVKVVFTQAVNCTYLKKYGFTGFLDTYSNPYPFEEVPQDKYYNFSDLAFAD